MRAVPYKVIKASTWEDISERLSTVKEEVNQATEFVKQIEQGNLDVRYNGDDHIGDGNLLASSLISMRNRMKQFSIDEKQRNWTSEGLASFVDILRSKNDDLAALADTIVGNLVRYMEANQGALYMINDDDPQDVHLEMMACYAYDRKKFGTNRIGIGEGMTGQVVLEKQTMYRTDIPSDFVKITSGLGAALPRNLIIVPLMLDQKVYGVVELASFETIRPYQIEFVERLGESIAATISSVKGSARTRKLLTETQEQAEQMRSQEEEMRQNMEELTATQEEMHRILKEVQSSEQYVTELLNVSTDSIYTMDRDLKLLSFNKVFSGTFERMNMSVAKGFDMLSLYTNDDEKFEKRTLYNRVLRGEIVETTDHIQLLGLDNFFIIRHAPLFDKNKEIVAMAVFARDVTELIRGRKKAEDLLEEAQQQSEEMKAQEEELRQNMEELSATQEEMQRILLEVQGKEAYQTEVLNASEDEIFTVDMNFQLVAFNQAFVNSVSKLGFTLGKGDSILSIFDGDPEKKAEQEALYGRALKGERYEQFNEFHFGERTIYNTTTFCPLRDANQVVYGVAVFGRDMTAMTLAQKETERLSRETAQQNEELKAQEEELRQNMEELAATQEEMQRILTEVQGKENYLSELINASSDSIFTVDLDLRLISSNRTFSEGIGRMGVEAVKGLDILFVFKDEQKKAEHRSQYERALKGESFSETNALDLNGDIRHFTSAYSPMRGADGKIFGCAVFGRDVTDLVVARLEAERLANAAQQQNEELKAQEEELRQNMEELAATQEEMQRILNEVQAKEAYMVDLINATRDSIVTIDRDYRVVNFNLALEQSYAGNNIKVTKGLSMETLFTHEQWPLFKANYDRAFAGEHFDLNQHYHSHGFDAWFTITHSPLRNEKGEITGIAIFAKDVTTVVKAQQEVEKSLARTEELKNYYTGIIEGMGDSIVTVDRDFKIVVANSAFKRIFSRYGVTVEPGESILTMAKGAEEAFKQPYLKAFSGQATEEPRRCHFDHYFHVFYHPIYNSGGDVIGACLIAHDITARIQEAEKYKARIEELERKLRVA